jgi:hypothetical protein
VRRTPSWLRSRRSTRRPWPGWRRRGRVQHAGHLAGAEPEDVAQNEDGELARRQDLQGGHERQGDGFGLLVARFGAGRPVDRTLQEGVGKRLQPYDLAEAGPTRRCPPPQRRSSMACDVQAGHPGRRIALRHVRHAGQHASRDHRQSRITRSPTPDTVTTRTSLAYWTGKAANTDG